METVLIDMRQLPVDYQNESNYIRLLMLLSKKMTLFSKLALIYGGLQHGYKGRAKQFFSLFRQNNLETVFKISAEDLEYYHKELRVLKSKKYRTPFEIKRVHLLQGCFERIQEYLNIEYRQLLEDGGFYQLIPWIDREEMYYQTILSHDMEAHQEYLKQTLPLFFEDNSLFLVLFGFSFSDHGNSEPLKGLTGGLLLTIPVIQQLTFDELEFTRQQVLKSFESVEESLLSFRTAIGMEQFKDKNIKKVQKKVTDFMLETSPLLIETVSHQLFIEKINATKDSVPSLNLSLAATNREKLMELLVKVGILSPTTANELKQIFVREGNLHNGCLVMLTG